MSLIESQNNLKEIRLYCSNRTFTQLGEALIKQSDTLTTIHFINFMCIPIDSLNKLVNIKNLNIIFPYGYYFETLNFINLPRLEVLKIQGENERRYDDMSLFRKYAQLIEKTETLREIFVDMGMNLRKKERNGNSKIIEFLA